MIERCSLLPTDAVPFRSCADAIDSALPSSLRMIRAGSHVVIFYATDAEIVVLDFLHQSADLAARIAGLSPDPDSA